MTVDQMKQALIEVQEFCSYRVRCTKCPFGVPEAKSQMLYECRFGSEPVEWNLDDWKEVDE